MSKKWQQGPKAFKDPKEPPIDIDHAKAGGAKKARKVIFDGTACPLGNHVMCVPTRPRKDDERDKAECGKKMPFREDKDDEDEDEDDEDADDDVNDGAQ